MDLKVSFRFFFKKYIFAKGLNMRNTLWYKVLFSNMKKRISVTVDEETDKILSKLTKDERYRNKSHAIEEIILKYWRQKNDKTKK